MLFLSHHIFLRRDFPFKLICLENNHFSLWIFLYSNIDRLFTYLSRSFNNQDSTVACVRTNETVSLTIYVRYDRTPERIFFFLCLIMKYNEDQYTAKKSLDNTQWVLSSFWRVKPKMLTHKKWGTHEEHLK